MMPRTLRLFSLLSLTGGVAMLVMACSLQQRNDQHPSAKAITHPLPRRIAQLGFGRNALFAACIGLTCPAVTRKTLPVIPSSVAQAAAPVVDIASTLDANEELLPAAHHAGEARAQPSSIPRASVVIHFASGSSGFSASATAALDRAMPDIRSAQRIRIIGRTDSIGSHAVNQSLALARARVVRDYLQSRLSPSAPVFMLDAQGACCFVASNDTPEGRQRNRRVEIVFSVPEQAVP